MSVYYSGQIQAFASYFVPLGFQKCEGQTLEISRYPALFSIIELAFGGDGRTNFSLPDLRKLGEERGLIYGIAIEAGDYPSRDSASRRDETFLGVIEIYASSWVPGGTAACEGQLVEASTNEPLVSLLKNRYGGDGTTNCGLPDLRTAVAEDNLRYSISVKGRYPETEQGWRNQWGPEAFIGQVQAFACGFAPANWMPCEGQVVPVRENQALYSLLGTRYGGTPHSSFQLPDLRPLSERHGVLYCTCVYGVYPPRA